MAGRGEVALALPAAHGAGRLGHPVAVHADVRPAAAPADRDRRGLAAVPALAAGPAGATPADLAERLPGGRARRDRLDLPARAAGGGKLPGPAPLADPAALTAEQRQPGPPADRARRDSQGGRAAGDQLGGQPARDRRRADDE